MKDMCSHQKDLQITETFHSEDMHTLIAHFGLRTQKQISQILKKF